MANRYEERADWRNSRRRPIIIDAKSDEDEHESRSPAKPVPIRRSAHKEGMRHQSRKSNCYPNRIVGFTRSKLRTIDGSISCSLEHLYTDNEDNN